MSFMLLGLKKLEVLEFLKLLTLNGVKFRMESFPDRLFNLDYLGTVYFALEGRVDVFLSQDVAFQIARFRLLCSF